MAISRRKMLQTSMTALGVAVILESSGCKPERKKPADHQFTFCLNTSTIREQKLGLRGEIETAAKAGYDGVEIWVRTLEEFIEQGGNPSDIKKLTEDLNIRIESAIGFPRWIVDDDIVRREALEQAKREMGLLASVGCFRMAAPPFGATETPGLDLKKAADRYADLLKIGDETGVLPQLELWGFSANLHLLGETLFVASECRHPKACILADVYHIYKGGSDFSSLRLLDGSAMHLFHMNDYPAQPSRDAIADRDRVYPGDGIAPLSQIIQTLHNKNSPIVLSLELFNADYWQQDPLKVARTGLDKMKNQVAVALNG